MGRNTATGFLSVVCVAFALACLLLKAYGDSSSRVLAQTPREQILWTVSGPYQYSGPYATEKDRFFILDHPTAGRRMVPINSILGADSRIPRVVVEWSTQHGHQDYRPILFDR